MAGFPLTVIEFRYTFGFHFGFLLMKVRLQWAVNEGADSTPARVARSGLANGAFAGR